MIDVAKLKEVVALMKEHDVAEVNISMGEESIAVRRGPVGGTVVNHQPVIYQGGGGLSAAPANYAPANYSPGSYSPGSYAPPAYAPAPAPASPAPAAPASAPKAPAASGPTIDSPMVGTFYAAATPTSKPFVSVGQSVTPDTVVCIIEAMKVFNEIKAEKAGVIEAMLVKNGEAVEFGQKLFALKA